MCDDEQKHQQAQQSVAQQSQTQQSSSPASTINEITPPQLQDIRIEIPISNSLSQIGNLPSPSSSPALPPPLHSTTDTNTAQSIATTITSSTTGLSTALTLEMNSSNFSNLMGNHLEWRSRFQNVIQGVRPILRQHSYIPIQQNDELHERAAAVASSIRTGSLDEIRRDNNNVFLNNHDHSNHYHHHQQHHHRSQHIRRSRESLGSDININNNSTNNNGNDDDDNATVSEVFQQIPEARNFLNVLYRYIPFLLILVMKLVYDHAKGILEILILEVALLHSNKILKQQIILQQQETHQSQSLSSNLNINTGINNGISNGGNNNNNAASIIINGNSSRMRRIFQLNFNKPPTFVLLREASYIIFVIVGIFACILNPSDRNNIGLLIFNPNLIELNKLNLLFYYVIITDILLKLITILVKILISILPQNIIKIKRRGRIYAVTEAFSQFYRSLAPIQSWLLYLLYSYTGIEKILGVIFSALYMGSKGYDIFERGKFFITSFKNFMKKLNYGRQPTREEIQTAITCPICHDNFDTPVVLECQHIFCEQCVGTWFTREQTCPLCRMKIADDPTYQDGSTTHFLQLF